MTVQRVRIDLAYDGTSFSGWAAQPGRRTVEGELSAAVTTLLRVAEPVRLTVAGRTDAGVHARGQVAHADVDASLYAALPGRSSRTPGESARARLEGLLPHDIVVRSVRPAPAEFDARFSALRRRYLYRICDRPGTLDPLRRHDTVVVRNDLDVDAMEQAAGRLVGLRDFAAFCRKRVGATTVRTLLDYSWRRADDGVLEASVIADAFCHSMVRALVGAVVPVGLGRAEVGFPFEVQSAAVRNPRVRVMPAHGLSLEEVTYPAEGELAQRALEARATRTLED